MTRGIYAQAIEALLWLSILGAIVAGWLWVLSYA